jgi:two-component system KDP operon response regulator KdpE
MPTTGNQPVQVLLLVDDRTLAQTIRFSLNHGQFLVEVAENPARAAESLSLRRPHLSILDMDGFNGETMRQLGYGDAGHERIPVIALTRRGDLKTKLDAFNQGCDDVVTVPFAPDELLARTLVVIRRSYGGQLNFTPLLKIGELEIDIMNRSVRIAGSELHLTSLQHSLLYLLAANAGQLLTRDQILDYLWGPDYVAESNVVDRHVRDLRAQLQNSWRHPRYIATIPGQGYRFIPSSEQPVYNLSSV